MDCGLLLLSGETKVHEGQGHKMRSNISKEVLRRPTELFPPMEDNKTFAVSTTFFFFRFWDNTQVLDIVAPR